MQEILKAINNSEVRRRGDGCLTCGGASPVGRDDVGRSYAARTVGKAGRMGGDASTRESPVHRGVIRRSAVIQ